MSAKILTILYQNRKKTSHSHSHNQSRKNFYQQFRPQWNKKKKKRAQQETVSLEDIFGKTSGDFMMLMFKEEA
jgi:hypothetical protein